MSAPMLEDLIARAQAKQPLVGFDPRELVEFEPGLTAAQRARRLVLGELLAALLVARTRRDPWYVWITEDWLRIKAR